MRSVLFMSTFLFALCISGVRASDFPVAYWAFDEGSGEYAGSQVDTMHPFEIFGASWNNDGISGSCLEFNYENGYGNYAEVRDTSFAACEERFSFSMWVYPYTDSSLNQKEHILEKSYSSATGTRGYQVALNYGHFHFSTSQPDGQWENGGGMMFGPLIEPGRWYHLAFTWDMNVDGGALYGYVDGVPYHIYSKTTVQHINDLPLLIGRYDLKKDQQDYCFNGRLDEIRYYGRALDSAEVAGLYHEFDAGNLLFTDVTAAAGVAGAQSGDCHGAYWGDIDNDGDLDLLTAGYFVNTDVFINNGNGTFTDVTAAAGVDAAASSGVLGDYDNDGDLDYFSSGSGYADKLYRNNGDGTFTDVAAAAGLGDVDGYGVAFFDYDLDGDLDLYVACNPPGNKTGTADVLYRNNGDGTFTDVTTASGTGNTGSGMGVTCADLNGDRYPEIFIGNNFNQPNVLYRNNGDGTFTDVADSAGVAGAWDTKCAVFGDYDNDGDLDMAVTNQDHGDQLFRNDGGLMFTDVSSAAGFSGPGNTHGGCFSDFDNDGDLDLYLTGYSGSSNMLYRNNGDGTLSDITDSAGVGLDGYTLGCAAGDYNGDGYLDIYAVRAHDESNVLYRNEGYGANWIGIDLEGAENNHFGIGSEVRVYSGGNCQVRQVQTTTGMYSKDGRCAHFGLGNVGTVDSVIVCWPDGRVTRRFAPAVNEVHTITDYLPAFTSTPPADAVAGMPWTYYPETNNDGSHTLTFGSNGNPAGMTIDPATGTVYWVPAAGDTGTASVKLFVGDENSGYDTQWFDITVHTAADSAESSISDTGSCFFGGTGVRITVVSLGGSGRIKVIVHADSFPPYLPTSGKPIKRTYKIEADSTLTGLQVALTLAYLQEEFDAADILNENSLYAARYHNGKWERMPSQVDTLANTVTCTTDGFSIWAIGGDGGALPVSLTSFTAVPDGDNVLLRWITASETDNLGWNVERRAAGAAEFDRVNGPLIPGAGTTTLPQIYEYTDAVTVPGAYLYRLEQVDYSGTVTYSDAVDITLTTLGVDDIPSLVSGSPVRYGIRFRVPEPGCVRICLYGADGTECAVPADGYFGAGENAVALPDELADGVYLVRIEAGGEPVTAKLIIAR